MQESLTVPLQPDQQPALWDDHVSVYEAVFERLTNDLGARALAQLRLRMAEKVLDVGAGAGGTALLAAATGAHVYAIDASEGMVKRIAARSAHLTFGGSVRAEVMDGTALAFENGFFDAAISVLGVILFPDAEAGMREIYRVLKSGGRVAIVTWTEPERYELISRLFSAIASVRGPQPRPAVVPAQLRFKDESDFRRLLVRSGFQVDRIVRLEAQWRVKSAALLARNIDFAPGMAALMNGLGGDRNAVLEQFVNALQRDFGEGEVALGAVASLGIAAKL
jgi:ubiquinone/menaquinone biosynthesis C-methylase UbiE